MYFHIIKLSEFHKNLVDVSFFVFICKIIGREEFKILK